MHKRKFLTFILTAVMSFFLFVTPVFAFTMEGGDRVDITTSVDDDVYAFGGNIDIKSDIEGDLICAGGGITIDGNISGDLIAAGGNINLNGNISDDAKIAGGVLVINGRIEDDLMISGSQIILKDGSEIGGDLVAGGGVLDVEGTVYGETILSGDSITIAGKINGSVKISNVRELTITDGAEIKGDVIYSSTQKANISDNARIGGEVKASVTEKGGGTKIVKKITKDKGILTSIFSVAHFRAKAISFISLFILGILLLLGIPKIFDKFNDRLRTATGICAGAGAAALFGIPVAVLVVFIISILLFITFIGAGAGIIVVLANLIVIVLYILLIYLSTIFLTFFTGSMIFYKSHLDKDKYGWKVLFYFIGLVIVLICFNIPFIGWLCRITGAIFGLGGLVMVIKDWSTGLKK